MSVKKHIPNAITSCNIICGCLSIVFAAEGHVLWSAYAIFIATIFDFGDGLAARALKVQSEIGKQLDSLADMITFGVAPAVMIYFMLMDIDLQHAWPMKIGTDYLPSNFGSFDPSNSPNFSIGWLRHYLPYLVFFIPVFSAIRLAKFNVDESQSKEFKGLATPANAVFFAGLAIVFVHIFHLYYQEKGIGTWGLRRPVMPQQIADQFILYMTILSIVMSFMLVAPIRMFSFKFKSMGWNGNEVRYIFIVIILLSILGALLIKNIFIAAPIIILLYIIVSMINNLFRKKNEIQS